MVCLTTALALFIATVYMYDRLSMPRWCWLGPELRQAKHWPPSFRTDSQEHGYVYAYMIRTWRLVFTPAVIFAFLGFAAVLAAKQHVLVSIVCLVSIALAVAYYFVVRPRLGID